MDDVTFYTIPEAAELLKVSPAWLRIQLAAKPPRFRHRRVGNRYEMSDEHIALAHAELEVEPAQPEPETAAPAIGHGATRSRRAS